MLRLTLLAWLLPTLAQGAHVLVDVTPKDIHKYDIDLTVAVVERDAERVEADAKERRVTYRVKITSKNINLRNCAPRAGVSSGVAHIQVDQFKVPILQVPLGDAPDVLLKADTLTGSVTFSADAAEKAYLVIIDGNLGASYSYRFRLQDWVKMPKRMGGERK